MLLRRIISSLLKLFSVFLTLAVFTVLVGWIFRPDIGTETPSFSPQKVGEIISQRTSGLDPDNVQVINQEVDYEEGPLAAWYPRRESPILAELVEAGKLPPLEERVGPEPLVMKGVEGIGKYGGTWIQASSDSHDVQSIGLRMSYAGLVRWSPQGKPIRPHIAKSFEIRDNHREFIFHLRKGMRWSDGHPFTADDILYWWEDEATDPVIWSRPPDILVFRGKPCQVEKIDNYTVSFRFSEPYALFMEQLATRIRIGAGRGNMITDSPAHYLRPYHPTKGNQALIAKAMKAYQQPSSRALYTLLKNWDNPEHPRLWPWIYRTYKSTPPQAFIRNPYFFAVDPEGNQLPYIDRMLFRVIRADMIALAAASGELSLQFLYIPFEQYELLMAGREAGHYDVYHWNGGGGSLYTIHPNLNRKIDPEDPATLKKRALLRNKNFVRPFPWPLIARPSSSPSTPE